MNYLGYDALIPEFSEFFKDYKKRFIFLIDSFSPTEDENAEEQGDSELCDEAKQLYEALYELIFAKSLETEAIAPFVTNPSFCQAAFLKALFILQAEFTRFIANYKDRDVQSADAITYACERLIWLIAKSSKINQKKLEIAKESAGASGQQSEGFSIHADFKDFFTRLINAKYQLEFLNLYNGVVVRSFAKSLRVEGDALIAELDLTQLLAMSEENCAYIVENDFLGTNLKAQILWVNTTSKTAALGKFEPLATMHALKRAYPRVHPHRFTKITLTAEDGTTASGQMYDLSQDGMGVVSTEDAGFKSGDILTADIELKHGEQTLCMHLRFRLIVCISYKNAFRYCMQLLPNQKDALLIEDFAKTRESETIDELNALIEQYGD